MLNRKTILLIGLTLMLVACSTSDNGKTGDGTAQKEVIYVVPMSGNHSPVHGDAMSAPNMDFSYNRVVSEVSDSSIELFSLDGPPVQLESSPQPMALSPIALADNSSTQSAVVNDSGMEGGVPSSTDDSVTVFPFSNDIYTPGIKAGMPEFQSFPRGCDCAAGSGTGPSMMANPAMQIEDIPLYIGSPDVIYFNHGSAALSAVARGVIASVVQTSQGNRIIVEAHASQRAAVDDPVQRAEVNHRMSMKRAMAVTKALIAQGIPETMIKTTALGDTKPAVPEVNKDAEALNRRVEILSRP